MSCSMASSCCFLLLMTLGLLGTGKMYEGWGLATVLMKMGWGGGGGGGCYCTCTHENRNEVGVTVINRPLHYNNY